MALDYNTYDEAKANFRWSQRWALFEGTKERFNISHECIDRHPGDNIAIRIKFDDGHREIYRFGDFSSLTRRFANYLGRLGLGHGEKVALLLFPSIEFYTSMFGIFRRGAVVVPCSPLFGPEAVGFRLEKSGAKAIVCNKDMAHLVEPEISEKLGLTFIFADDLLERLEGENDQYDWDTNADTICMMQFSSGTTGAPKSVVYRHGAITVSAVVTKFGVGFSPEDVYFCPSSAAWGHGIWYGTIAPLTFGIAIGTFSGKFDPEMVLETLEEWGVTTMAAISSHYRLIMETGKVDQYNLKINKICYTGEAMTKEVMEAIRIAWGIYPHVQFGTTEAGPVTLDYAGIEDWVVKPGSLGKPMIGGYKVGILDEEGHELPTGEIGQIALWRGGNWLRTGDSAYMDEDGYFWYVSRIDDVIISAGYTIGPIEVEGALLKHPAVEESAVVGSPEKGRGELVKAFIMLKEGYEPSEDLGKEIQQFVKTRLSKHEYPREVEFIDELPKTPDGKLKRSVLKSMEIAKKTC